jgi:hypothetical protein
MFSMPNASLLDAVVERAPERVRALMREGANPHEGIYPHRDATSPLTIARGADPVEADAESWASPRAWAAKSGNQGVIALLE